LCVCVCVFLILPFFLFLVVVFLFLLLLTLYDLLIYFFVCHQENIPSWLEGRTPTPSVSPWVSWEP
jgi:hypothetical protein